MDKPTEMDPCFCRKAVPGMWTSGEGKDEHVRHGAAACPVYVPKVGTGERITFDIQANTCKATLHRPDGNVLCSVEVGRSDGRWWDSATQAMLGGLYELVPHITKAARRLGIPT